MNKDLKQQQRRNLIKGALIAGAAAFFANSAKAASKADDNRNESNEILYKETPEFRAYYDSLRD